MNERIRLLANELGPIATIGNWGRVEWKDNVYPQLGDKLYAAIDLQKFGELIVRKCSAIVQDCVDRRVPASEYPDVLKQSFGVEE